MKTQAQVYRRMMLVLVLICLFFTVVSMACADDGGTIQETGNGLVSDLLLEQSRLEQDAINLLQNQCAQSSECASHQLP